MITCFIALCHSAAVSLMTCNIRVQVFDVRVFKAEANLHAMIGAMTGVPVMFQIRLWGGFMLSATHKSSTLAACCLAPVRVVAA